MLLEYNAVDSGIDGIEIESVKLQIMEVASANKTSEARLLKIERQFAAVIAQRMILDQLLL